MQRREFLRTGLLLGATGAVPGIALATSQLSGDLPTITGLVLPPLDDSAVFDLLVHAIEQKHLGIVKSLIEQGVDVHATMGWAGGTPLHIAASGSSMAIVRYLVSQGADVHAKDNTGITPLHRAVRLSCNIDIVKYLVSQGAGINVIDKSGRTPLHEAVQCGIYIPTLEYLIAHGADPHVRDNKDMTALDYVMENESKIIERIESQPDATERIIRWRRGRVKYMGRAIDLLRKAMG
jgi:ankyrin repeat protein